jgi:hypothetical protein
MNFFKFLPIIFITTLSSVSNSIAQVKKPNVTNFNASILNKLTGMYVYEEGISTQNFQSFQRYTTDLTLEYDKINKIYKCKIKRHVLKRDGVLGPLTWFIIDGSQYSGRYDIVLKDTTIRFTWLKKQKSGLTNTIMENLLNAKIESNELNGDTILVFSNSIKFKRTHKIQNNEFIEIKDKLIIEDFEILENTFSRGNFSEAKDYINKLEGSWRLPTKYELNLIYKNKNENNLIAKLINNYKWNNDYTYFWSSSESIKEQSGIALDFDDGAQFETNKINKLNFIAIRLVKERSKETLEKERIFEEEDRKKENIKLQEERKKQLEAERVSLEKKSKDSLERVRIEDFKKNIIGQPIELDGLLIAEFNFPNLMNLATAIRTCEVLGPGWRLPNYQELLPRLRDRQNKNIIPKFSDGQYWVTDGYSINLYNNYPSIEFKGQYNFLFKVRAVKSK